VPAERSLASALLEIRDDLKMFAQTRAQLLRAEISEKMRTWKSSMVFLTLAAIFLLTGWFTSVFAVIALLNSWIVSGRYGWFLGGLIVSAILLVSGALCGRAGYRAIKASGVKPTRTLRVLKQDQEWIQRGTRPA
jgi:Putative Actinobacterial Holin-X, holin superfamily III